MAQPATERNAARRAPWWLMIGPGLLLAATGVGSGDLATGAIAGSLLGPAVLWAVLAGALLKFVVTEGLARWQLATGDTLLEGAVRRLGPVVIWLFFPYLFLWSFFVGSAQVSASGVTLHAMFPVFDDPRAGKIVFGIASGLAALGLVWFGGYRVFERAMQACIGLMFVMVVVTSVLLWPGTGAVLEGVFLPRIPAAGGEGPIWTVALIGGVGGTLTVLCYGYWLREEGRTAPEDLPACRIDLAAGYLMTALFGMAMVIVGSSIEVEGEGTELLVSLSGRLADVMGPAGKWLFLVGTFGAVWSSVLGVWQAVPYLFADCWALLRRPGEPNRAAVDTASKPYRVYLLLLAIVPMLGLFASFREVQKIYTVLGALFFPLLALAVLVFNGRASWVGARFRNGPATILALAGVLLFFSYLAFRDFGGG